MHRDLSPHRENLLSHAIPDLRSASTQKACGSRLLRNSTNNRAAQPTESKRHQALGVTPQLIEANDWAGLAALTRQASNIGIWQRALPERLVSWLDCLDPASLPTATGHGTPEAVAEQLREQIYQMPDESLARADLAHDLTSLVQGWAELTGTRHCFAQLEVINVDLCTRFHTDMVGIRLLCTYRGPGTLWVPNQAVRRDRLGTPPTSPDDLVRDPTAIRQIPQGAIALLKGDDFHPNHPGVVHRSPPVEREGLTRLLFRVDSHLGCSR